jgi:hypothetical protein
MDVVLKNVQKKHLQVLKSLAKAFGFEINKVESKSPKTQGKGFDAIAFSGTVKFRGNPVEIQKQMRNDWE